VLSLDEKTLVRDKRLARPDTPPKPCKEACGGDYEYTSHGTMNLFAALRVHNR
jgi:hypothetical protein